VAERGRASRAAVVVVAAAAVALILGGCEAFMPGFGEAFPSSSPIAAYSTGSATIAIKDGETIELDKVAAGSGVNSMFGSEVRWTGPGGWHLRVSAAGAEGAGAFGAADGYVTLDRIVDGKHWTTMFDGDRCITNIAVVDATAIRGSATCKGVAWYDALDMQFTAGPPKPLDEPKFDAEITFEAVP
jgi:hypothetical protein